MSDRENKGAIFSPCRTWRYVLWRGWDESLPKFAVIGLNPSTADECEDDPTIRRCVAFAKRENCGALLMFNLYAYRATDPRDLKNVAACKIDIRGPDQDMHLREMRDAHNIKYRVAAWGANAPITDGITAAVFFGNLQCFGTTKSGAPRHPLYIRGDTPLVQYDPSIFAGMS